MNPQQLNQIFIKDIPLLDVRAPVEFKKGAFPHATNIPILNDSEREEVGVCHKMAGPAEAVELGHQLVSGSIKSERIQAWRQYITQHPQSLLYCFRGGSRSHIAQKWLAEQGVDIEIIPGGYKMMRQHLLSILEEAPKSFTFTLIGGLTGNGKTDLIHKLDATIDLEGLAHHRGSSFGAHATPQSTQINFENQLAINLLKLRSCGRISVALEDEGRCIGSVDIPKSLFTSMRQAPLVVIEDPLERRIDRLLNEYVIQMQMEFIELYGKDQSIDFLSSYLLNALDRIKKRLGNIHYAEIRNSMETAIQQQRLDESIHAHTEWLRALLTHYYDPMYQSQLKQKLPFIQFRGNFEECEQYLRHTFDNSSQS